MHALINFYKTNRITNFLILLNLGITIPLAAVLNIWVDEAYSLNTSGKDIGYAIHQAIYFELQPPLYFVLLNIWRSFNHSIFFARLFSVFCIALSIYIAACLSKRFLQNIHPAWFTAAVAFNPFTIYAAVEIRLPSLAILLTSLLLLFFFDGYLAKTLNYRARWYYLLVCILAIYTQYYLGFLLVANACVLLILKRWRDFRSYILSMVIVGLCFVPMLLMIPYQLSSHVDGFYVEKEVSYSESFLASIKFIFDRFQQIVLPIDVVRYYPILIRILRISLFLTLGFLSLKAYIYSRDKDKFIWVILGVTSLLFIPIYYLTGQGLLAPRHTIAIFLPFIIYVFSLFNSISKALQRIVVLSTWTITTLLVYSDNIYNNYKSLAKEGDWQRVAAYIKNLEQPGQPIVVFHNELAIALEYYYQGSNSIVPIPKAIDFKSYNLKNSLLRNEEEVIASIANIPGGEYQSLWLVTNNRNCEPLPPNNCEILAKVVSKNFAVKTQRQFYGVKVQLLHKNQTSKL